MEALIPCLSATTNAAWPTLSLCNLSHKVIFQIESVTVIGGRRNNSTAPPATSVAQTSRIREWLPAKHDCIVRCKHEKANNG